MSAACALCFTSFVTSPTHAQLGAGLLFKPWVENQQIEGEADTYLFNSGTIGNAGADFGMTEIRSQGRYRFDTSLPLSPSVGYSLTHLSIHDTSNTVAGQLIDVTAGIASPLIKLDEKSMIGASAGLGYAGDNPFGNGRAWYGQAGVYYAKQLDNDRSIVFSLDYDGNHSFFPDIPIPGVTYSFHPRPNIDAALGFPYDSLTWRPADKWTLSAELTLPYSVEAEIDYELTKQFVLFGKYDNTTDSFHFRGAPPDRRIFLQEQRLEAGLRWIPCKNATLIAAGGYAFSRSFETGFDTRSSDTLADISDEPYVRLGLQLAY